MRLFACACCRRAWHLIEPYPPSRQCVEFAEGYADGIGAKKRLKKLVDKNIEELSRYAEKLKVSPVLAHAAACARSTCDPDSRSAGSGFCKSIGFAITGVWAGDAHTLAHLVRCIVGNPFRPVAFDPGWRSADAVALARTVYDDRAFDRLPLLADALEAAGCGDAAVLGHLRGPGPHARGCWAVDGVLGLA